MSLRDQGPGPVLEGQPGSGSTVLGVLLVLLGALVGVGLVVVVVVVVVLTVDAIGSRLDTSATQAPTDEESTYVSTGRLADGNSDRADYLKRVRASVPPSSATAPALPRLPVRRRLGHLHAAQRRPHPGLPGGAADRGRPLPRHRQGGPARRRDPPLPGPQGGAGPLASVLARYLASRVDRSRAGYLSR